jgi:glycine cleavage system aminomethyltransferase T/glycine/D-amino acid oxidase-like deaminating enzyme
MLTLFRSSLARRQLSSVSQLPSDAEIIVIGGGVIGCSVAYHLAKQRADQGERVLLLEAQQLTSGTTWHAAGLIGQMRPTESETALSKYGSECLRQLEEETGQSTEWRNCGSLTLARDIDRLYHLRRLKARADAFGIDSEIVSGAEARHLFPPMQVDDVEAALWLPGDGTADPSSVTRALAKGARMRGVTIAERTRVVGVAQERGSVSGVWVQGDGGDEKRFIGAKVVVNCGGMWARRIGQLAGVSVPLCAAEHFYAVTKPLESVGVAVDRNLPVMRDPDGYTYFREWGGGLLFGGFEPVAKVAFDRRGVPDRFEFSLFPEDYEHFEVLMNEAVHRVPSLADVELRQFVNGPESFTADNAYLLGEAPELGNFYVAAGFNSSGIASSPGAGKTLAEWILNGRTERDMWTVDCRRFGAFSNNNALLRARTVETLGLHYAMAWPRRELESARHLRRSPLYDRLRVDHCAVFGSKFGWERPNFFAPSADEAARSERADVKHTFGAPHWRDWVRSETDAVREHVALFDQSSFAKLLVQGRDAADVLRAACANNVVPDDRSRVVYTAMCNERGGIESDVTVTRLGDAEFLVVTSTGQAVRDRHLLERRIADADATVADVTSAYAVIGVQGPKSRALLEALAPDTSFADDDFAFSTTAIVELGMATVRASRVSYVGAELGWELLVPTEMAAYVYDALMSVDDEALRPRQAGYYAIESLRVANGFRAWAHDLTPDTTPYEAGIGFAVDLSDESRQFVGRDALVAQKQAGAKGLPRRLVQFRVDKGATAGYWLLGGETILADGVPVGYTTSAHHDLSADVGVALGYVNRSPSLANNRPLTKKLINASNIQWQLDLAGTLLNCQAFL